MDFGSIKPRVAKLRQGRLRVTPVYVARSSRGDTRVRDRVMVRDKGLCHCARCLQSGALLPAHQVDHVRPLWAGGAESDDNRASINVECHKRKTADEARMRASGAFDPSVWVDPYLTRIRGA
jgi:5-methylcytosine-specific restriction endonuclease McrA